MKMTGLKEIQMRFKELERKTAKKVIREGVKAGGKIVLDAAKANAPKDTGTLQKAMGNKTQSKNSGLFYLYIVGARKGQKRTVIETVDRRGKKKIKLVKTQTGGRNVRDASKYLHLAESGRKAVQAGQGKMLRMRLSGGKVVASKKAKAFAGHGFMKKTWATVKAQAKQAALEKMKTELQADL